MHAIRLLAALALTLLAPATAPAQNGSASFAVTVEGAGPDLILIPGTASSQAVWDATAERRGLPWRSRRPLSISRP